MVSEVLRNFVDGKGGLTYQNDIFGRITYPLEEAVFLLCLYNSDEFYEEMRIFAKEFISDEDFLQELFRYQKAVVLRPGKDEFTMNFSYNFSDYFDAILSNTSIEMKKEEAEYKFSTPFSTSDWIEYAKEIIWYGRRNNRMMFSSMPNRIDKI